MLEPSLASQPQIEPSLCTYPQTSLAVAKNTVDPVVCQTVGIRVVMLIMREFSGLWIKLVQSLVERADPYGAVAAAGERPYLIAGQARGIIIFMQVGCEVVGRGIIAVQATAIRTKPDRIT